MALARASVLRTLEWLEERELRVVFMDKKSDYKELLKKTKLATLEDRRTRDILILMYKVKYHFAPIQIRSRIMSTSGIYVTSGRMAGHLRISMSY